MKAFPVLLSLAMALAVTPAVAQDAAKLWLDTAQTPEVRARALVGQLTLEEKAQQYQYTAPAITRLGVPAFNWWSEGLHGVARAGEATVFPQAIGLAATFDTTRMHSVADVIGTEFRAVFNRDFTPEKGSGQYRGLAVWSPNVNIFRDPRWGRGQETYGEDPVLTAQMGVAFIRGLQGDDPKYLKTLATVKHFAVHSGPEPDRHKDDIHPSAHDEVDTYLPAFHAAVKDAHVAGLMCAYNAVNGVPACGYQPYMQGYLRKDWGFKGYVTSDCAALGDIYQPTSHAYVKTPEDAITVAIKAGTDLNCDFSGNKTYDPQTLVNAVKAGQLTEAEVDTSIVRLFEQRIRLGLFDPASAVPYNKIAAASDLDTPAHQALSEKTAEASMVLLKNDGLLPLKTAPKRIAVIGPNADSVDALVGNYNGTPSKPITVLAGIKARFPQSQVDYVIGTGWVSPPLEDVPNGVLCVDAACTQAGLKFEEFQGAKLEGAAVATRTDANAKFSWGRPTRQDRESSVRWAGFIKAGESGAYNFRYTGDTGYRIYVDGKLVADVWDTAWPTSDTQIELKAGQTYAFKVEAIQKGNRGDQKLQWSRPSAGDAQALDAAQNADLVVFVGGLTARLEGEEMKVAAPGFSGGDRTSLDLPAPQEKLLERLKDVGKPVVLVLMNGSAMSVNWADANIPAIVEAWYPGGEGGQAVAGLLAGDFSPSGRLPVTFYKSADDLPPFKEYSMKNRTYRYFGGEVLYPFGYGLSYTTFTYARPTLSHASVKAGGAVSVSVNVTNSGARDSDEVVQLYTSRKVENAPIRALQGFQRISLKAGETRKVTFTLDAKAMSVVDADGHRQVNAGPVEVWIGGGQPVERPGLVKPAGVAVTLTVVGQKTLPAF